MYGGNAIPEGLSVEEIREFARVFSDVAEAAQVLEDAGFPRDSQPFWNASTARAFWSQVARELSNGLVADGRALLFDEAYRRYSGNPVFATGCLWASSPVRLVPSPDLLPPPPTQFTARTADFDAVRRLLMEPTVGPVVGVLGMGGIGKSTLARALVHDPHVRATFPDGIAWVDVNPDPDLTMVVSDVLAIFGDTRPVRDVVAARRRLRRLLAGARCLVVLDDVWHIDVLDAVRVPAGVRLLVTGRNREALYTDSVRHLLGTAAPAPAREMLAAHAAWQVGALPAAADDVLELCGGLPLALALAGGLVTDDWEWSEVADALTAGDLSSLGGRFADGYQYRDLLAALDASVGLLPAEEANRFRELAVFKGCGPVPATVVGCLWKATTGTTAHRTIELLRRFSSRFLVRRNRENRTVIVHDLLFDYARATLPPGKLVELHGTLASAMLDRWGGLADRLPGLRDSTKFDDVDHYGLAALVTHLLAAGRRDTLDELLALDWPAGSERADNAWYTAHENVGRTGDYLTAVRAARRDAQSSPPTEKPEVEFRGTLDLET